MTKEDLFNKPTLDSLCKDLLEGKEVDIDGVKYKAEKADLENPTKSPCWSCTTKFGYSRKICQLCIHLGNIIYLKYKKTDTYYLKEQNFNYFG